MNDRSTRGVRRWTVWALSALVAVSISGFVSPNKLAASPDDTPSTTVQPLPVDEEMSWTIRASRHLGRLSLDDLERFRRNSETMWNGNGPSEDNPKSVADFEASRDRSLAAIDRLIDDLALGHRALEVIVAVLLDGSDDLDPTAPPPDVDPRIVDAVDDAGDASVENALDNLAARTTVRFPTSTPWISPSGNFYHPSAGLPGRASSTATGVVRPVRFTNDGATAVTVRVASFTPGAGAEGSGASNASTVVFPSGGSSAVLELPVGEYTFCYEWTVDGDADGDGYVDQAHATTGSTTLTEAASENPASATTVTVSPSPSQSANGRCGEATTTAPAPPAEPDPAGNATTDAEAASAGLHAYNLACIWDDDPEVFTMSLSLAIGYTADGAVVSGPGAVEFLETAALPISRTGPDTFSAAGDGYSAAITMTSAGAHMVIDYGEFWGVLTCDLTRSGS